MITKSQWASQKGLNPPLVEEMIDIAKESAEITNFLFKKEEIEEKDLMHIIDLRELCYGLKTNMLAIARTITPAEEGLKKLEADLRKSEEKLEAVERKGLRETARVVGTIYVYIEKIAYTLRILYHVIKETRKKFFPLINLYPEQAKVIRERFNNLLDSLNSLGMYYLFIKPNKRIRRKVLESYQSAISIIKDERLIKEDLKTYPFASVLEEEISSSDPKKKMSIGSVIQEEALFDRIDRSIFGSHLKKVNQSIQKLKKYNPSTLYRAIYGLKKRDIAKYYVKFYHELYDRIGLETEYKPAEELVKAKVEKGEEE